MKVKVNKAPLIVLLSIAAAFLIAAVLSFVVPMILPKPECPVKVTEKIEMAYDSLYREYTLSGEIENVSDETIVIKNNGGMTITCTNSEDKFNNGWFRDYSDIVLEPNGTYNFENCIWALAGGDNAPRVTKVVLNIDGTTYYLVGNDTPMVLVVVFGIFALVFAVCALVAHKGQKDAAKRKISLLAMCESVDEDCVVLEGILSNKNESKKAAAKSAASVIGGVVSAIFLGFGAYKIYSGSMRKDFVLGKHGLYMLDSSSGAVTTNGLYKCTKENFAVGRVFAKKSTVNLEGADKNTNMALFVKNCPITVAETVERLNAIFITGTATPAVEETTPDENSVDPFADDATISAPASESSDEVATTESSDEVAASDDETNE